MDAIDCRELRIEDVPGWRDLHNTTFPSVTEEEARRWARCDDVTIAVAMRGSDVVGAIPFQIRDFQINPRVTVRGAIEHAVVVDESLRDQGLGSRMMRAAKQFLAPQCDAMMVYRGGERSIGYRFYTKTGHHDLSYLRPHVLDEPRPQVGSGVLRGPHTMLLEREAEFLQVFHSAFGSYGGFWERKRGYFRQALGTVYFDMIPQELVLLRLEAQGALQGYALVSREDPAKRVHTCAHLLELATRDADLPGALSLLREAITVAAGWGAPLRAFSSDHSPYAPLLIRLGLRPVPRSESSMMTMAYIMDAAAFAGRVWLENPGTEALQVSAWTPEREALLHRPLRTPATNVVLELKEDTLTRLLFSRLDLVAAVRQELVTVVGGSDDDLVAIAQALPFAPWAYHHLDYI